MASQIWVLGRLGADPELRYIQGSETAVLSFSLAETYYAGKTQGKQTQWFKVSMFGKRAESLSRLIQKGSQVVVQGQIRSRKWEDKEGATREAWEIKAFDVALTGSAPGGATETHEQGANGGYDEDNIPF